MRFMRPLIAMLVLCTTTSFAANEPVHVVKFISFNCATCRQSETMDDPIRTLAESRGGRFVVAPLPRGQNDGRERLYYAMRSLGADMEVETRLSLFEASQDLGYPLSDMPQSVDWLRTDLKHREVNWSRVAELAAGAQSLAAVERAVQLAVRAGVQVVPSYVIVRGESVIETLDTKSVPGVDLPALRSAVLEALRKAQPPLR